MDEQTFSVYRGLQKPLIFKGLKGKFIYWGGACVVLSLLLCCTISVITSFIWGGIFLVVSMFGGLGVIIHLQKKGLHNKDRRKGTYIVSKVFSRY